MFSFTARSPSILALLVLSLFSFAAVAVVQDVNQQGNSQPAINDGDELVNRNLIRVKPVSVS